MINTQIHPKVSILIPVFNRKDYITECIQSALDQTFTDFEIVLVDNASNDGTWEICQQFATLDQRIRIFRNESNIGPVRNWMRCIEAAKGVFGKILFSDDLISRDFLEKTIKYLDDPNIGFVFSAVNIGKNEFDVDIKYSSRQRAKIFPSKFFVLDSLLGEGVVPVSPGAALFRLADLKRFLVDDIKSPSFTDFYEHGAGPDMLLYLLIASQYRLAAYVIEPLAFFRVHAGSISMEGAHTIMHSRYFQAKIWFANEFYGQSVILKRVLCKAWLDKSLTEHRWFRFDAIVKCYLFNPVVVGPLEMVVWIGFELIKRIFASAKHRIASLFLI
nr:glycosyltransferase family 2 protein [uncultured Rhodoferax sp.]